MVPIYVNCAANNRFAMDDGGSLITPVIEVRRTFSAAGLSD